MGPVQKAWTTYGIGCHLGCIHTYTLSVNTCADHIKTTNSREGKWRLVMVLTSAFSLFACDLFYTVPAQVIDSDCDLLQELHNNWFPFPFGFAVFCRSAHTCSIWLDRPVKTYICVNACISLLVIKSLYSPKKNCLVEIRISFQQYCKTPKVGYGFVSVQQKKVEIGYKSIFNNQWRQQYHLALII